MERGASWEFPTENEYIRGLNCVGSQRLCTWKRVKRTGWDRAGVQEFRCHRPCLPCLCLGFPICEMGRIVVACLATVILSRVVKVANVACVVCFILRALHQKCLT
ncbi:hypothetical protein Y1Q_0014369 [Alligator mississippiensis]|uniref:Uncharacterized protein n=1 Tax=Alligator mississippiensis TaxID=8496 RepID=A0A151N2A4_ALLMI|nr:hypothetical protein Y1Q_0014369 [Alligator mississippiensis]